MFGRKTEERWYRIPSLLPVWSKSSRQHSTEHEVHIIPSSIPLICMYGVGEDANCKGNSPPLPTPVLTAPWQSSEASFSHHVPQELHHSNRPLAVWEVQREGDVSLRPPDIFWALCPSHETDGSEASPPSFGSQGSWCPFCLSYQYYIVAQPAEQG